MKKIGVFIALSALTVGWPGLAAADPWKDESGNGRWRGAYERGGEAWRDRRQDWRDPQDWRGRPGWGNRGEDWRDRRERRSRQAYEQEFRRGDCKVKRKWDGDEYREEVRCKRW